MHLAVKNRQRKLKVEQLWTNEKTSDFRHDPLPDDNKPQKRQRQQQQQKQREREKRIATTATTANKSENQQQKQKKIV